MKIKYEVREGGKYRGAFDNEKEAIDLVDSQESPVVFDDQAYVVKITEEVIHNPYNRKIKGN